MADNTASEPKLPNFTRTFIEGLWLEVRCPVCLRLPTPCESFLKFRLADLIMELIVSNYSDSANAIAQYGLELGAPYNTSTWPAEFSVNLLGDTVLTAQFGSSFGEKSLAMRGMKFDWLANPVNIPPHEMRTGWVSFPLPSIPQRLVKGVPFALHVVPSEGKSCAIDAPLGEMGWKRIGASLPSRHEIRQRRHRRRRAGLA